MSDRTWGAVVFNALIVAGFIVLIMTVMHGKNVNKVLSEEISQAQVDFQAYRDKAEVCFKNLASKTNEINER